MFALFSSPSLFFEASLQQSPTTAVAQVFHKLYSILIYFRENTKNINNININNVNINNVNINNVKV